MATNENLQNAFAGESQANRKYLAFSEAAEREGLLQIAKLFRAAAEAETVHAMSHLRVLGWPKTTAENLKSAMEGESYEFNKMYPAFYEEAVKEGNKAAAGSFGRANSVEEIHFDLYGKAAEAVAAGKDLGPSKIHVCSFCGNTILGDAPDMCPVCHAKKEQFFEVK